MQEREARQAAIKHDVDIRDRGNSLKVSRDLIVLEGYLNGVKPKADEALESETVDVRAAKQPS